jgi:general L-amino acid transport system permease protein
VTLPERPFATYLRSPAFRAVVFQILIIGTLAATVLWLWRRAVDRLAELGINSGFGFLDNRAGFDIGERVPLPQLDAALAIFILAVVAGVVVAWLIGRVPPHRIGGDMPRALAQMLALFGLPAAMLLLTGERIESEPYTANSTFSDALIVGALNTLRASAIALVLSTLVGLVVALMRLSPNWLLRAFGRGYVELVHNLPLLLQLFFWYFGVLRSLPSVRNSVSFGDVAFLNNRGLYLPEMAALPGFAAFCGVVLVGLALAYAFFRHARRRDAVPGAAPTALLVLAPVLLPAAWIWLMGSPVAFELPTLKGFNFQNATVLSPEFTTLVVAMTIYHGAYAAEIIRSGIQAVPKGQIEAAQALSLGRGKTLRLVVLPQAIRIVIPPMISRYLGLIKSSSLAVAIGYPEIVSIGRSIEFATGQALELVLLTMAFYLTISITISVWMNWYNARVQLVSGT